MANPAKRITRGEAIGLAKRIAAASKEIMAAQRVIYSVFTPSDVAVLESYVAMINKATETNGKQI